MVKNKKSIPWKTILVVFGILIILFLIWGFIGGQQAQNVGVTCDMGIGSGEALCWNWHKNAVGQAQEALSDLMG